MQRSLSDPIQKDLSKKIILISGPRQSGKTTLSKMLSPSFEYLNYDNGDHRNRIERQEWDRKKNIIILDELHKMPRWKRTHLDIIIKQHMITLEKVINITGIENLIRLLKSRVGSTISYNNLASDLSVDPKTVKSWLNILERLYVIFKLTPYSKKIKNSLLKAPKYYFYDNGQVDGDEGAKLENLVAGALLKEIHFREDVLGEDLSLHFLRTKGDHEIDFVIVADNKPKVMIEVKWADDNLNKNFQIFAKFHPHVHKLQLVGKIKKEKTFDHQTEIRSAAEWLSELNLTFKK